MTSTAERTEDVHPDELWLSHRQVMTILSGLLLGMFLSALDQNIVSVAIVRIANSLHGFNQQAWATTAYLITATISTPLYGKLADIYGRKPFYLLSIGIFIIGSAACSFATSMYELAGFRAFQGLGAGGLMSLALTIIGDIVPARERVRYQGYFMIVFGGSTVLGPVLGGLFSNYDHLGGIEGWRWVFLVNVPIGIIALFVVAKVLNVPHHPRKHRIDWFGALTLAVCVVPLLIVAEQGRDWGWGSVAALVCYCVSVVGLVMFLLIEYLMKDEALIPLRLFKSPTFSVSIIAGTIIGVAMFGGISMVPQYFQVVRGYSPTKAGLLMLPLVLGITVSAQLCGWITKLTGRYKILPVIGTFVLAVGAALFAQIHYNSPMWQPLVYGLIIGAGLGGCMQTLIIAAQNAGPRRDMGVSTAAATFFRQMGGTLGVAVFLTILFNLLPHRIIDAFGGRLPMGFDASKLKGLESSTGGIAELPSQIKIPILTGFTNSMHGVFYTAAAVALVACIVLLFMKEIPLQSASTAAAGGDRPGNRSETPAASNGSEPATGRVPASLGVGRFDHAGPGGARVAAQTVSVVRMQSGAQVAPDGHSVLGHILRPDGHGVPAAVLTLVDQHGHQVSRAVGGSDGSYVVGAPGSGHYLLIVSADGYQPQAASVVVGVEPAHADVTLVGSGTLTGVITVAGLHHPPIEATVMLTDARGEVVAAASADTDGRFAFSGVGAGGYTLVASVDGARPTALAITMPDSGVLNQDIELESALMLAGAVRNDEGREVPDARIVVQAGDGTVVASTRADRDGRYVVTDLFEGEYTVVASGYPPVASRVMLSGAEVTHDLILGYESDVDSVVQP